MICAENQKLQESFGIYLKYDIYLKRSYFSSYEYKFPRARHCDTAIMKKPGRDSC